MSQLEIKLLIDFIRINRSQIITVSFEPLLIDENENTKSAAHDEMKEVVQVYTKHKMILDASDTDADIFGIIVSDYVQKETNIEVDVDFSMVDLDYFEEALYMLLCPDSDGNDSIGFDIDNLYLTTYPDKISIYVKNERERD